MTLDPARLEMQFWDFASTVTIPSKDEGMIRFQPWQAQRYMIREIFDGLAQGIHEFVVLKRRQMGATTCLLCFDAYWMLRNKGLQGSLLLDDDDNMKHQADVFKEIAKTIAPRYSYPIRVSNRHQTSWIQQQGRGGSRLLYGHAGKRGGRLGRSKGINFLHASEVAFWPDPKGIDALKASLSESHPLRCYIWESTANGFNHFYDMWDVAQRATTMKAIFVAWWRHEHSRVGRDTRQFQVYWDGRLTNEEAAWQRELDARYGITIDPEQWAWYRWKENEDFRGDSIMMMQEYPTLPEHAFQATGFGYLGAAAVQTLRATLRDAPPAEHYRYTFGPTIETSEIHETVPKIAHLTVWEQPRPGNHYVIAADPAFGAGKRSDNYIVSVWRAERTRLVQCAEFAANDLTLSQFAWVCMHLCGSYVTPYFILEVNGPGLGVWQEIQRLAAWGWGTSRPAQLNNLIGAIQHYVWRRPDAVRRSAAWQWQTTAQSKHWIMSRLRDQIVRGAVVIRSEALLQEFTNVRQDGDKFITEGRGHDDRVMSAALAVESWAEQVAPQLAYVALPIDGDAGLDKPPKVESVEQRMLRGFFDALNVRGRL